MHQHLSGLCYKHMHGDAEGLRLYTLLMDSECGPYCSMYSYDSCYAHSNSMPIFGVVLSGTCGQMRQ